MVKFRTPKPPLSFGTQTNFFQAAFGGALLLEAVYVNNIQVTSF
jgi:hypothetical protein